MKLNIIRGAIAFLLIAVAFYFGFADDGFPLLPILVATAIVAVVAEKYGKVEFSGKMKIAKTVLVNISYFLGFGLLSFLAYIHFYRKKEEKQQEYISNLLIAFLIVAFFQGVIAFTVLGIILFFINTNIVSRNVRRGIRETQVERKEISPSPDPRKGFKKMDIR